MPDKIEESKPISYCLASYIEGELADSEWDHQRQYTQKIISSAQLVYRYVV